MAPWAPRACPRPSWVAAVVACALSAGEARRFSLDHLEGPGLRFMQGRYRFHASGGPSLSGGVLPAGEASVVQLSGVAAKLVSRNQSAAKIQEELSLQLAFVPVSEFAKLGQNFSICSKKRHFELGYAPGVVSQALQVGHPVDAELKLLRGGWHIVVLANCRLSAQVALSGSLAVQSRWGYLDGPEYWQVPIYTCALLFSAGCLLFYLVALARQEEEVRDMQYSCVVLGFMGLLESAAQTHGLYSENMGLPAWSLGDALYLMRLAYCLALMLSIMQGSGLVVHSLDWEAIAKCYGAVCLYVLVAIPKVALMSIGPHLATLTSLDIIKVVAPVLFASTVMVCWAVGHLRETFSELEALDDEHALQACRYFAKLFLLLILGALAALAAQVSASLLARDSSAVWWHALCNDAIASAALLVVTCALMHLSMEDTLPPGVGQVPQHDEEDSMLFAKGSPPAQTIGMAATEDSGREPSQPSEDEDDQRGSDS